MAATVSKASGITHTKVALKHNPNFKRNGLMNYLRAMRKCKLFIPTPFTALVLTCSTDNFGPTLPGPYTMVAQIENRGNPAIQRLTGKKIGGKAYVAGHVLAKKDAATGQTGEVPVRLASTNRHHATH